MSSPGLNLHPYLLLPGNSKRLSSLLESLTTSSSSSSTSIASSTTTTATSSSSSSSPLPHPPTPELKLYSDILYVNHHSLGLSLSYKPHATAYKLPKTVQEVDWSKLRLVGMDVYNYEARNQKKLEEGRDTKQVYKTFPCYPIIISVPASAVVDTTTTTITSSSSTTPSTTPSTPSKSPTTFPIVPTTQAHEFTSSLGEPDRKGGGAGTMGIWCEWTQLGLMVEFASAGLQAWEKGRDARWKVLSLFESGG
ncbi:BQ2448_6820 [Microbotryum intermedium]|uniref:BQ2448_6820 protein n=1 Tax=Microbotryum intermedium TaxID=269621 RepID=A0A238FT27_9BASI|nr:BQ2448_6820 [Microbotryum intermedium]